MTMTIHENNLRLRHEAIERGPSMRRLYSEACDHCGAWSEEFRCHPSCTECMASICKACIVPATWQEPDEGDWGKGICKRCARFTSKSHKSRMEHYDDTKLASGGVWAESSPISWCEGPLNFELGASFAERAS